MLTIVLPVLLLITSVFLILLVLIQRGRGGGLAGAFGGLGGQSAFGTKAGDLFTRITIGVAAFWIILCAASVKLLNDSETGLLDQNLGNKAAREPGLPAGTGTSTAPGTGGGTKSEPSTPAAKAEPATSPPAAAKSDAPPPASTPAPEGTKSEGAK